MTLFDEETRELEATLRQMAVINGASPSRASAFVNWALAHSFDGPISLDAAGLWYNRYLNNIDQPHEPTKQRPGDQPLPVSNDLPAIQDLVIADIEDRKRVGLERYGSLLKAHNGRDALQDAFEEAIDLAMYLKQLIYERDNPKDAS